MGYSCTVSIISVLSHITRASRDFLISTICSGVKEEGWFGNSNLKKKIVNKNYKFCKKNMLSPYMDCVSDFWQKQNKVIASNSPKSITSPRIRELSSYDTSESGS